MDSKYIGATVQLPHDVKDTIDRVRERLSGILGFNPSLSETIAYVARFYERAQEARSHDTEDARL